MLQYLYILFKGFIMSTQTNSIDRKNKIIGITTLSAIALILVAVIVLISVLSGRATVSSNGYLMQDYKINRKTAKITEDNSKEYIKFCNKIMGAQVENGGNTAMSFIDTANTLSFLASASSGNTRKQIENLLCQSAEDTAAMVAGLEKRIAYKSGEKYGIMSSNTAWLNTTEPIAIKKSFLSNNANRFGLAINRESFSELSTSTRARETVVDATDGNTYTDVQFNNEHNFNIISGASFKSLWVNGASTDDTYENLFFGENEDFTAEYFKTIESKYISSETFVGTTKEYQDGFTFVGVVPRELEDNMYYTLKDVVKEISDNNLLPKLMKNATNAKVEATFPYYVNSVNNPTNIDFAKTLQSLEVTSVFRNSANFSEMTEDKKNLRLDNFYVSGDISITPAGAINNYSNKKISEKELEDCNVEVAFTRSFMYFIYDNESNLPVYFGVVNNID